MPEAAAKRRLAAILAADVVGYSRLMETAEAATLARLKAHRAELIDPLLAAHGGRLIKLMGDGALVEFPSVVEAVACAIDIQQGMAEREAGLPDTEAIRFRIGINLGDVLIDGDDLYGDGVNIAARLEALAEPGGIVLSAAAFDQVSGKLPVAFRDLGEHSSEEHRATGARLRHRRVDRHAERSCLATPMADRRGERRDRGDGGGAACSGHRRMPALARAARPSPWASGRRSPCCRSPTWPIRPMPISATA